MIKHLTAKQNNRGFTLAELLVVVAIIGVLVAIAIPIFTGQLERARVAVDQANVRSAKAAAAAEYMTGNAFYTAETYYYDGSGVVLKENTDIQGYGKSTNPDPDGTITGAVTSDGKAPKGGIVRVEIDANGVITAYWEGGSDAGGGGNSDEESSKNFSIISSDHTWDGYLLKSKYTGNKENSSASWSSGETITDGTNFYVFLSVDDSSNKVHVDSPSQYGSTDMADYILKVNSDSKMVNQGGFVTISSSTTIHAYSSDQSYHRGDVVRAKDYRGSTKYYIAVSDIQGVSPSDSNMNWAGVSVEYKNS